MIRLKYIHIFACGIIPLLGIGIVTAVWGSLPYVTLGADLAFMGVMVPGYFMHRKVQRLSVEKDVLKMEHHLVNEWKAEEVEGAKKKDIKPRQYYDSIDGVELPGHSEKLLRLRKLSQELGLDGTLRTTSRLLVEGDDAKTHLTLPRHIRKQQFKSS